jgi:hypothetical protein
VRPPKRPLLTSTSKASAEGQHLSVFSCPHSVRKRGDLATCRGQTSIDAANFISGGLAFERADIDGARAIRMFPVRRLPIAHFVALLRWMSGAVANVKKQVGATAARRDESETLAMFECFYDSCRHALVVEFRHLVPCFRLWAGKMPELAMCASAEQCPLCLQ